MPEYFAMTIQRRRNQLTDDYVKLIYESIIESGYPFKSGYWFHEDATYDEIITWNQAKLEQGFQLGYSEHVSHDYMQILFNAPEYEEMRGYWMCNKTDISFNLIIPEYNILNSEGRYTVLEHKIAPIREMAIRIWEEGLADVIQTSMEFDGGYYSTDKVLNGKNIITHPFAIIPREIIIRFGNDYFAEDELIAIGNDGILINEKAKNY